MNSGNEMPTNISFSGGVRFHKADLRPDVARSSQNEPVFNRSRRSDLQDLKETICRAIRAVPGILSQPEAEAVVTDVTPDAAKIRILWSTKDSRQYQMLASYDQVLIAVARAIDNFATATQQRSAA
jgi:hypothetical protein